MKIWKKRILFLGVFMIFTMMVCIENILPVAAEDMQETTAQSNTEQETTAQSNTEQETTTLSETEQETTAQSETQSQTAAENETTPETKQEETTKEQQTAELWIDNQNCYEGMEKTYSEGYLPKIENNTAYLVVPILCNEKLKDNQLTVSLNLGSSADIPFVYKNYEKTIFGKTSQVNDGSGTMEGYVAEFALELKDKRYNGNYPVGMTVSAWDENGNKIEKEITVYVTVSDGRNPDEQPFTLPQTEPDPAFVPKIMIEEYEFSKTDICPGDEVTVKIVLKNTSRTESIKNLTVTSGAPAQNFNLLSKTDSLWIDSVPAGRTCEVTFTYEVRNDTPQGQYDLSLAYDYADSKGGTYSGSGKVKLTVGQMVRLEFDPINISSVVQVGDVTQARLHVMNLGKGTVYNIRAAIEADGLSPEETLFIGNLDAGKTAEGSVNIRVSSLSKGDVLYGKSTGSVTILYEDASGKEYKEVMDFSVTIQSPFSNETVMEEGETGQWWIVMAVIVSVLCVFLAGAAVKEMQKRKDRR